MAQRTQEQIETLLKTLSQGPDFIYDVLTAYGFPKATVTRLRNGNLNLSKEPGQIIWKRQLCYQEALPGTALSALQDMRASKAIMKHRPRFLVVSDGRNWSALDTKDGETREFPIVELYKHSDFFLPWTGREKAKFYEEKAADINAARKMGKLFDAIKADNPGLSEHALNVFMARLLFCFFAEDSGILPEGQMFTDLLEETTLDDGTDMAEVLARVFAIMNMPETSPGRQGLPIRYAAFPYVNGGLFAHEAPVPVFSRKSREAVLAAGYQDWAEINTDIFGNMFQACQDPAKREELGEHYTSVPNIMKVLNPLFLEGLREEAEKLKGDAKAADRFLNRISRIRFFDPACGSGNFLIVAFKELRELEMDIIDSTPGLMRYPRVNINQFYGIEIDDFAHEVAMLSMWLVDHQMNERFRAAFETVVPTLPLKPNNHIVHGNALRMDWEKVCPKKLDTSAPLYTLDPLLADAAPEQEAEIYIFGNPPYGGGKTLKPYQKEDMAYVFSGYRLYQDLDYVSAWFLLAARYISGSKVSSSFVSTNSITQGTQVPVLWPYIFSKNVEITCAYTSFKWTNNARNNAGVTCVIIELSDKSQNKKKRIITGDSLIQDVRQISPYLIPNNNIIITGRDTTLSETIPPIMIGNAPVDDGHLILGESEYHSFIADNPKLGKYCKKYYGAGDYLKGIIRYCFWFNSTIPEMETCPFIEARLQKIREFRLKSKKKATQREEGTPHLFIQRTYKPTEAIIAPRVSSERRPYIPFGYVDENTVVSDSAFVIYDAEPWVFAIISSAMHMAWVRVACGRLETRIRYSAKLCYNTFPIRELTDEEKERLNETAYGILDTREKHTEMTLGDMYNPESMPDDLKRAHEENDRLVDSLYRNKPFFSEEERLECLFALYQQMTGERK